MIKKCISQISGCIFEDDKIHAMLQTHTWRSNIPGKIEAITSHRMIRAEPQIYGIVSGDDCAVATRERGATVPSNEVVTAAGSIVDLLYHKAFLIFSCNWGYYGVK